jgi:acyl-CoA thioester hydrolase
MPAIYLHEHTVLDEEIDGQGHVNNLVYLHWMQSAAVAHSTAQGWPPERYQQAEAGWVVRTHNIEYLVPAFAGEQIVVRTWVADFKKLTSLRKYRIVRPSDEAVLAVAETNWVFIGYARRMPRRIPVELSEAFDVVTGDE